jgi:hypothetical protein
MKAVTIMNEYKYVFHVNPLGDSLVHYESPRDYHVSYLAWSHKRYDFSGRHSINIEQAYPDCTDWFEIKEALRNDYDIAEIVPVYLFDHSGLTIRHTPFNDIDPHGWDWGQLGFMFITREDAEFMEPKELLLAELNEFASFVSGDVWEITLEWNGAEEDRFIVYGVDRVETEIATVARNRRIVPDKYRIIYDQEGDEQNG